MPVSRHRPFARPAVVAVLAAVALLTACGTQTPGTPQAGDGCAWYETGPQPDGATTCAEGTPGAPEDAAGGFDPEVGRIAMSADGNQHDEDDWASAPMALAILAERGLQANLVHYDYNDHIWDSSDEHLENMTESVQGAGERFGFDMSRFFDDTTQLDAGIQNLVTEINASTAEDQLAIVLAGPMETVWRALDAANADAREHVRCVSHGRDTFNQNHAKDDHGGHSYDDLIELGCQKDRIPDQNSGFGPTDMDEWEYLEEGDENQQWLYSRLELVGNGDVSDAGMVYYVITGDDEGDRSELRNYFGK
ncbi:MAG: hypothetical protein ACRDXB_04630 [Actinomycetes bacterium]